MPGSPASRIVITGIGAVSPFGVGRERFWDHVRRGCSGTRAITGFDAADLGCRVAAAVPPVTIPIIGRIRSGTRVRRSSASSRRGKRGPMPVSPSANRGRAS
jgi:3-oxoacyl-(acyl-carrier-protein) synthase